MPLVILLHGYGASAVIQEAYFQVKPLAEEKGFLYVAADGTTNIRGDQFWKATDACCGFGATDVDDVAYLTAIIDQVSADRDVDPKRIYLMGHSNGGFMSYRMACDLSGRVAAIASLAGATFADTEQCAPDEPVSVLQVHGTADGTIAFDGGTIPVVNTTFPGARTSVTTWAGYDGCDGTLEPTGATLDLEANLAGAETTVDEFGGCPAGVSVELWTIVGGAHIPGITFPDGSNRLSSGIVDFLLAHPKA
jgi:polyhydroxybutyrate depolymerase